MTEQEYRSLAIDSYSSIKVFIEDRKKYYRKFVLGESIEDEDTQYTIFGSMVDCLQFKPEEFESKFVPAVTQFPKPQYKRLVEKLMDITVFSTDESGIVRRDVLDMLEDAYNALKYDRDGNVVDFKKDSFEVVKTKFIGTEVEMYYRQLRESHGKQVVELSTIERANGIVQELKTNPITRDIMMQETDGRYEVYNQFPIIGELSANITGSEAYPLKCLVDKLIIDHEMRTINFFDLKTAWDNEGEFYTNYRKYKYYIQLAVYFYLVNYWKDQGDRKEELKEYRINDPAFIVAESSNYKSPLIYQCNESNISQGARGFTYRGWEYIGLVEAVKDLIWHKKTGIWNISRKNYETEGVVEIPVFE